MAPSISSAVTTMPSCRNAAESPIPSRSTVNCSYDSAVHERDLIAIGIEIRRIFFFHHQFLDGFEVRKRSLVLFPDFTSRISTWINALPLPGSSISVFSTVHCLSACSITLPGRMVFAWIFILNFRCLISPDKGGGTYQFGPICAIEDRAVQKSRNSCGLPWKSTRLQYFSPSDFSAFYRFYLSMPARNVDHIGRLT